MEWHPLGRQPLNAKWLAEGLSFFIVDCDRSRGGDRRAGTSTRAIDTLLTVGVIVLVF
jgi:hypothetical protein